MRTLAHAHAHCSNAVAAKKLHLANLVLAYCATGLAIAFTLFLVHVWGMTMDSSQWMEVVWLRGVWLTFFLQILLWTPIRILFLWFFGPCMHAAGLVLLLIALVLLGVFSFKCPEIVLEVMESPEHKDVCLHLPFQFWVVKVGA